MKNSIRLALAALALVLTALASIPRPAQAALICENLSGRGCSVPGRSVACVYSAGYQGACYCDPDTRTWFC